MSLQNSLTEVFSNFLLNCNCCLMTIVRVSLSRDISWSKRPENDERLVDVHTVMFANQLELVNFNKLSNNI